MNGIRCLLLLISVVFALTFSSPVQAAKPRVQKNPARPAGGAPAVSKKVVAGVAYSTAKLSSASKSIVVSFLNLDKVRKISYLLNYTGSGQDQGVGGAITPNGTTDSRDLYFGTCSHGVCTPHYTIKNAKLLVTATLKSGGTRTKRYIIRPKW